MEQEPTPVVQPEKTQLDRDIEAIRRSVEGNPGIIPERFRNAEDPVEAFIKSYSELQADHTKKAQELAALQKPVSEPSPPPVDDDEDLPLVVGEDDSSEKGLDWEAVQAEVIETGSLTDKSREAILAMGIPAHVLDAFVLGQQALMKQNQNVAAELVGGKDELKAILEYAKTQLTPEEKATVNEQLKSPGWRTTLMGLKALKDKNTTPREPTATPGVAAGGRTGKPPAFRSTKEMVAAMRDPRYQYDPEYQRQVAERTAGMAVVKRS